MDKSLIQPNNNWCYTFTVEPSVSVPECFFPVYDTAFNLADPTVSGLVSFADVTEDSLGSVSNNQFIMGHYFGNNDFVYSHIDDYVLDPLNITYTESRDKDIPVFYNECETDEDIVSLENYIGESAVEKTVGCYWLDGVADHWTVELAEGQTLRASVDHEQVGVDVRMVLAGPDECLIDDVEGDDSSFFPAGFPCSAGEDEMCPSIEYTASNTGTYAIFIYTDRLACADSGGLTYTIDASVQ